MKRKLFALFMAGVMAAGMLSGCSSKTKETEHKNKLVFVDWGGTNTEARLKANVEPFEEEYDCEVTVVTPSDYAKLIAMVENDTTEWDVMNCDAYWGAYAGSKGYLEAIDYDVVTEKIDESVQLEYVMGLRYMHPFWPIIPMIMMRKLHPGAGLISGTLKNIRERGQCGSIL